MKAKRKINAGNLISLILMGLAHVAIILAIIFSYQYYAIYPSIFGSAVCIIVCILIIADIIFFVGFNYKDKVLKIVSSVLATLLLIGGTAGTFVILKVNGALDNVLEDGSTKYEKVKGVFVSFSDAYSELKDIDGEFIGALSSVSDITQQIVDENNLNCSVVPYDTSKDLLQDLSDGDVDIAVFSEGYRDLLKSDDTYDYSSYLDKCIDFYSFEEEVKVETTISTKNISSEPFNVLLIGWSRVDIGSSVGLADAIIVATVNPQTYTVSMTSIARDSYVPIDCYNGAYDKINSGRSTSRECFINTVENLLGMEMDFYIEADYDAIVAIVDAIGGVEITNPTAFNLDGVDVPEGTYVASGWQALEFCRERHAFADGDFARQQHQKEVILGVVKKLVTSKDLSIAMGALNAAGDYISTNLTLNQLTSMFNMILNTKNYTGLETFDLLDFQSLKVQGYASWTYSTSYGLPLWIYKLYEGSIAECVEHIEELLGDVDTSNQEYSFVFSAASPYERPSFVSDSFDEKQVHDVIPDYYPYLTDMTYGEALEWATEHGVSLDATFITADNPKYDASKEGMIIEQSPRYGLLVSDYPTAKITVMGSGDTSNLVPNFKGKNIKKVYEWAEEYDFSVILDEWTMNDDATKMGQVYSQSINAYKMISSIAYEDRIIHISVYDHYLDTSTLKEGLSYAETMTWIENNLRYGATTNGEEGELISYSCNDSVLKYSTKGCKFNFEIARSYPYTETTSSCPIDKGASCTYTNTKPSSGEYTTKCSITWSAKGVGTGSCTYNLNDKSKELSIEECKAYGDKCSINWVQDSSKVGQKGACVISYNGTDVKSVSCSEYQNTCQQHEQADGNGACKFVSYSLENQTACPFEVTSTTEVEGTSAGSVYTVTYTSASAGYCTEVKTVVYIYSEVTKNEGESVSGLYVATETGYLPCGDADVAVNGTRYYSRSKS